MSTRIRARSALCVLCALSPSLACMGFNPFAPKPTTITHAALPDPVFDSDPHPLDLQVLDPAGKVIPGLTPSVSTAPAVTAEITADGKLRCLQSGTVNLQITHGDLIKSVDLRCRPVATLGLPGQLRLTIGSPRELEWKPADAAGQPVADIVPEITAQDDAVLRVRGLRLQPLAVGTTTLTVRAGSLQQQLPVTVVRAFLTENLVLRPGEGLSWAMPEGTYEISVELRTPGSPPAPGAPAPGASNPPAPSGLALTSPPADPAPPPGVLLDWTGSDCPDLPPAPALQQTCTLTRPASLMIQSSGAASQPVTGILSIYQVK